MEVSVGGVVSGADERLEGSNCFWVHDPRPRDFPAAKPALGQSMPIRQNSTGGNQTAL